MCGNSVATIRKKPTVEAVLAELHELSTAEPLPMDALRDGLKHSSNAVVAKAATIVGARFAQELLPDLVAAAERFFRQQDQHCVAKIAIFQALRALEHTDKAMLLRALRHVQMEANWGGTSDVAAPLRAVAALAISECPAIAPREALCLLVDALVDPEVHTRIDVVRAIGQVGGAEPGLILRTKARVGDAAPEVIGQCLTTLIEREGLEVMAFAATFLDHPELRNEAAMAIAAQRGPESLAILIQAWEQRGGGDLLLAIGTLRTPAAVDWLLNLIRRQPGMIAQRARLALEPCRHLSGVEDALAESR